MDLVRIIEKKKKSETLSREEIEFFARAAAVDRKEEDAQLGAMLMAIRLNGLSREETAWLALAMTNSGVVADLTAIPGIPTDKHSTGGVGDTTTLVLVPLVAACGVPVAKMSGRGLGHTGGTLDKLESIPGFQVELPLDRFIEQVKEIGCAVVGQSAQLAPADKRLYLLRDITSTVDSLPLIAGSIMSKKMASGAKAIVLDVKTGDGAIVNTLEESIQLAEQMVHIGVDAGRRVMAVVTEMGEPLGSHVGNALEVKEAIDVLAGRVKGPLLTLALELGSRMLCLGDGAKTVEEGKQLLQEALQSGRGLETLSRMITAQGGDAEVCRDVRLLPKAPIIRDVFSLRGGHVQHVQTARLGTIAQDMGAGRKHKSDNLDLSVGFVINVRIGDSVKEGAAIARVHARDEQSAQMAMHEIQQSICIGDQPVHPLKLLHAVITEEGTQIL